MVGILEESRQSCSIMAILSSRLTDRAFSLKNRSQLSTYRFARTVVQRPARIALPSPASGRKRQPRFPKVPFSSRVFGAGALRVNACLKARIFAA